MDTQTEQNYLQLALGNPNVTCAEAPLEILEAAASEVEPTIFMEEYFAAGHSA